MGGILDHSTRNIINRALKSNDFLTRVALGEIEGWETLNKFGAGIATTDERLIRDGMDTGKYPVQIDTNSEMTIQSTDAADTGQLVMVFYTEYDEQTGDWNNKR